MAVLFAYGGDVEPATDSTSGSSDGSSWVWANGGGTAAITRSTTVRSGVTATGRSNLLVTGASSQSAISQSGFVGTVGVDYWVHVWFRIPSGQLPTTETTLYRQRTTSTTNNGIQVSLNQNGALKVYYGGTNTEFSGTVLGTTANGVVVVDTWHKFVLRFTRVAAGSDTIILYIDDVSLLSTTTAEILSINDPTMNFGWVTTTAGVRQMYVDDYVILDNSGSTFNGYPNDLHVNWLLPVSDNARTGTVLWTGGAGGTTNLWDAVDNAPPVGVDTTSDTDSSQIRHNGSGAGIYAANLPAYATLGIAAVANIASLQLAAATGEEVTTGTKLVRLGLPSGPTIADTADQDVQAGVAIATHPSGWTYLYGTRDNTAKPAAIATTPVMQINRAETAARAVACDFMGLQVVWQKSTVTAQQRRRAILMIG